MAVDLTAAATLPAQGSAALAGNNKVLEVLYDNRAEHISVYFASGSASVCFDDVGELEDGGDVGSAPQTPLVAGTPNEIRVGERLGDGVRSRGRLFLTSATTPTFYIVAEVGT